MGAKANGATTGIRDVTSGNTNFNGVTGFPATPGYDKASGWGTVDIGLFVPAYLGPVVHSAPLEAHGPTPVKRAGAIRVM